MEALDRQEEETQSTREAHSTDATSFARFLQNFVLNLSFNETKIFCFCSRVQTCLILCCEVAAPQPELGNPLEPAHRIDASLV